MKYRAGVGNNRRWHKIILSLLVVGSLVVVAAIFGIRSLYIHNLKAVDNSSQAETIYVLESGSTTPQIAKGLKAKDLIRSTTAFEQYVRTNQLGEEFKAGTYLLKQSQDVEEIVTILTEGRVAANLFTILPGQNLKQIRASFIAKGFSEAEVDAALNPANYAAHPALVDKPAGATLEGYLYPDSYEFLLGTTKVQTIIGQSLDEMAEALTPEIRAGMAAQGLNVYQGITLASIVEQEIPAAPIAPKEDRRKAAQVFLKRTKIGMQLGSDVTAFYGAEMQGAEPSVSFDSPYNTRIHTGFPPGPIGNVTSDGLNAVAFPANTDYLYFVAGDGQYANITYFTNTVEEHEEAVRKYCSQLCN